VATIGASESGFSFSDFMLPELFVSGTFSKMNNANGLLYSAAFYSSQKNGNIEGIAYFTFDPRANRVVSAENIPFSSALKQGAAENGGKKAFNNFVVREVLLKGDEGFLLVAEHAYSRRRASTR